MTFRFSSYQIDDTGIALHFVSSDPGAGKESDYYVRLTDAELTTVTNAATFATLVTTKLNRQVKGVGIATKLDARIGQSVVI